MNNLSQTIGLALGWLMVAWVGAQGLALAIKSALHRRRRERKYQQDRADFCRRIEATAQAARASHALADWSGWRRFRVAAIVDEAEGVKSFYFTPEDGRALSPFAPGQYLTFRLPNAGQGNSPLVRCYSLSDRARQDYYRTTIKRLVGPAHLPAAAPGRGSNYFHDQVRVGDIIEARAPAGTFMLDPRSSQPIVLIGAGIGVTPLVSMLEAIVQCGQQRDIYILFGFRHAGEHPFKERIATIAAENPRVRLHVSYSAPAPTDVQYRDYNHAGRISFERIREVLPSNNFHFYLCGPGPLMETLVPALWNWGVPESHVHFEAFGPASVRSANQTRNKVEPCEVRFERTGKHATWNDSIASILEFGEAAGVKMPSGCRAGSCGECMMAIKSGKIATMKKPGIPVPEGQCLTCISVPAGDLVLDA